MIGLLSLCGSWKFALDGEGVGIKQKWFSKDLEDKITLPGSTDEAKKGEETHEACTDRLSRTWRWIGPAWYQKTVIIDKSWEDKKIFLFLERTKDSQIWIDGKWAGSDESLSTPHEFDLSDKLTPGKHIITILIDNAKLPPVGPCHQVDERTQTNWNGILGKMELQAFEKVWLSDMQAVPQLDSKTLMVTAHINNESRWTGQLKVTASAEVIGNKKSFTISEESQNLLLAHEGATAKITFNIPDSIPKWDEFETQKLRVTFNMKYQPKSKWMSENQTITCGFRSFTANRGQFEANGRPTMLRGRADCAIFPLTGYASMDKKEWLRILNTAKDYGLNHYRFHSWCPPEAAFEAADEVGIYFQIELPNKRGITEPDNMGYTPPAEAYETLDELVGDGGPPALRTAYLIREGERILKHYGNHPSFVMLALGNEIGGDEDVMRYMLDHFRSIDDRHLYAMGSGHFHWDLGYREGDEFWVTRGTTNKLTCRGASYEFKGHVDHATPSTMVDYDAAMHSSPVPVVAHEMAQYEVYPDFAEIKKYKGVLKAKSLEAFKERLKDAGMLDQALDFHKASGAISTICHREDIEAALRTQGFGGFHMLDLMDFSGQGVALVGMLDSFMESKGLITPKAWREFCSETVPLLCMNKYTWTNAETFVARIRLSHYGPNDLKNTSIQWSIKAGSKIIADGETMARDISTGTVSEVDLISADLSSIKKAQKVTVHLKLKGSKYQNSYDLWVYPEKVKPTPSKKIIVARTFDKSLQQKLNKGATVLLMAKPKSIKKSVAMAFQSGFWSPMFRNKVNPFGEETPGTQGILCDPKHAMFKDFPTEFHTNWQWWQLVKNSVAMVLDSTEHSYRPLIQVIDGFDRNHKLGLVFEAKVGKGKIIVCSMDLPALQEFPEARQMLSSIYSYMGSAAFSPKKELDSKLIGEIV